MICRSCTQSELVLATSGRGDDRHRRRGAVFLVAAAVAVAAVAVAPGGRGGKVAFTNIAGMLC